MPSETSVRVFWKGIGEGLSDLAGEGGDILKSEREVNLIYFPSQKFLGYT